MYKFELNSKEYKILCSILDCGMGYMEEHNCNQDEYNESDLLFKEILKLEELNE